MNEIDVVSGGGVSPTGFVASDGRDLAEIFLGKEEKATSAAVADRASAVEYQDIQNPPLIFPAIAWDKGVTFSKSYTPTTDGLVRVIAQYYYQSYYTKWTENWLSVNGQRLLEVGNLGDDLNLKVYGSVLVAAGDQITTNLGGVFYPVRSIQNE